MAVEYTQVVERHEAAKKRLKAFRTIGPVILLAVLLVNIYSVADMFQSIDTDAVVQEVENRAAQTLLPKVQEDLTEIAARVQPVFEREITQWTADFGPKLEAKLTAETEAMQKKVMGEFERIMTDATQTADIKNRAILVKNIPELEGDKAAQDRVMATMRAAAAKWGAKQYTGTLHEHVVALEQMRKTLDNSYVAKGDAGIPRGDQVLSLWLELMGETVGNDNTILGDDSAKDAENVTEAKRGAQG